MLNFIVNPNAKKIGTLLEQIAEKLNEKGIEFEFLTGETKEEMREIVARLSENPVKIIAVGGDGTLNDVLTGISHPENVELGLIPLGTGNDFAASAGIPEGIAALDLILEKEAVYTDFIDCGNGLRSMNIAGLGIDVDILERCYRMKRGGKKSKYFRSLLASITRYKGQKIEVTANGETYTVAAFIAAVCNGRQFGAGIPICAPAVIDDGKLDLVVIKCPKWWKYPVLLTKLMRGKILTESIASHVLCEEARIVQVEGSMVQLDGELVESRVLQARVVSGKLKMFRG